MTTNPPPATPPTPATPPPAWEPRHEGGGAGGGLLQALKDGRVSYAFIAAACLIFYLSVEGDFSLRKAVSEPLALKYGAFSYKAVRENGEWWRYITTLFVSRYGLDLVIFGFIFVQAGPQLERVLGSARFAVLYLLAGAGGVALAEVIDPGMHERLGMGDTIVACYAVWGALPGVILGMTRSIKRTITSPQAQGAAMSIAFWSFLRYYMTGSPGWSVVGAALLGLLLAAGLTISKEELGKGVALTAAPLVLIAALIGLAASGKRWQDGKLVDRGRPATGRFPTPQGHGPDGTTEPPPSVLDPPEASNKEVEALREKVGPFLQRFGPLPSNEGVTFEDQEKARTFLAQAEKVVNGPNAVLGELDPERIKLNVLIMNRHDAARIARDHLKLQPGPYARTLAGLTAYQLGGSSLEAAEDHLEVATADEKFVLDLPEALYYYARVLEERHGLEVAHAHYQRYVRTLGDGPHPPWRKRLVDDARAKIGR